MLYILLAILLFEIIRLVLYLLDSYKTREINKAMGIQLDEQYQDMKETRRQEIESLKELAEGSKVLADILESLKEK